MSATNSTANYSLPIFVSTDVPSWLTDWNGAMGDIDSAIAAAKATADSALLASGNNTTDIATIQGQITTINGTLGTHTTQIGTISGNINTINALIGNGTPTTTDQTIIGAINELHADILGLVTTASDTKTTSGGGYTSDLPYTGVVSVVAFNTTDSTHVIPLYRSTSSNKLLVRFFDDSLSPLADGKSVTINVRYLN